MIKRRWRCGQIDYAERDIERMTDSPAGSSRSSSKEAPLVFVSTSTAVFSEASRTAARSHAAAWSRRRLKETKAKPKANQDLEPVADDGSTSNDPNLVLSYDPLHPQKWRRNVDNTKEANGQSISRQPEEQLSLSVTSRRSDAKQRSLIRDNLVKRGNSRNLSLAVCGSNGSLDPFNSFAVKVDSNAYELLQFYKRSPPMAWDSQPYAPRHDNLDNDNGSILTSCFSSKLHFYTFLSLSAALMETVGLTDVNFPPATLYSQCALAEMRIQLRSEQVNEQELLHGTSTLSIAAAIQGDVIAAQAHLRAAKYLVDRLGGFKALRPLIVQRIRYGDFHLAIETLSSPIFDLDFEPDGFPKHQYEPDPLLKQMRRNALQSAQKHLSFCLFDNVQRIIQCVEVLEGIWAQPNSYSNEHVKWLASKIGATMSRLLSTTLHATTDSGVRKAQEATKVILILWNLIVSMFAKGITADTPVQSSMPIFSTSSLEAMRVHWSPWIYLGLMSWNEIVRSPSSEFEDRGSLWSLINLVRSMEVEGLVHLADIMGRLYQLEDTYRLRKQPPEDLEFVGD